MPCIPPGGIDVADRDGVELMDAPAYGCAGTPDGREAACLGFEEQRIDGWRENFGAVIGAQDAHLERVEAGQGEAQGGVPGQQMGERDRLAARRVRNLLIGGGALEEPLIEVFRQKWGNLVLPDLVIGSPILDAGSPVAGDGTERGRHQRIIVGLLDGFARGVEVCNRLAGQGVPCLRPTPADAGEVVFEGFAMNVFAVLVMAHATESVPIVKRQRRERHGFGRRQAEHALPPLTVSCDADGLVPGADTHFGLEIFEGTFAGCMCAGVEEQVATGFVPYEVIAITHCALARGAVVLVADDQWTWRQGAWALARLGNAPGGLGNDDQVFATGDVERGREGDVEVPGETDEFHGGCARCSVDLHGTAANALPGFSVAGDVAATQLNTPVGLQQDHGFAAAKLEFLVRLQNDSAWG